MTRRWLIALGPLSALAIWLWAKLICFTVRVNLGTEWLSGAFTDAGSGWLVISSLAMVLILFALVPLLAPVPRLVAALVINGAATTVLLFDLMYFRFFDDVLSLTDLPKATLLPYVTSSLPDVTSRTDALYYVDIVIAVM